jgi:hypothetical protein
MMIVLLFSVLGLGLGLGLEEGAAKCRTRSAADLKSASEARAVWTPHVRMGSMTANTFFAAAEFAGLMGDGRGLENTLPCVLSAPEEKGGQTTFRPVRGGITSHDAFPESFQCVDPESHAVVRTLRDVVGEIFIVGHGDGNEPRLDIAYGPRGQVSRTSFGPEELADRLIEDGLACDHTHVTLLLVQGGTALSKQQVNRRYIELYRKIRSPVAQNQRDQETLRGEWGSLAMRQRDPDLWENNANVAKREIAFVTLLTQALTQRGLMEVEVTGFRGEVLPRIGRHPTNPGPYRGLKMYITSGMLAESFCTDEPNSEARQKCVDDLVAPCDQCMLQLASTGKSFLQRSKICQQRLLANPKTRLSAQTCGAEAAYATKQWIYSVHSSEVYEDQEP